MVPSRLPGGRSWFATLSAILLLSTGVAGSTVLDETGVVGHTSYVQAVVTHAGEPSGPEKPIQYGLATLREVSLFGFWSRERPPQEPDDWLVYTWAENTPDPRDNPSLQPTGDVAQIRDRTGTTWTVYELTYQAPDEAPARPEFDLHEPPSFHTYVVAPSETRTLEDGTRYNHVATYRPDRFVADLHQLETGTALQDHGEPQTRSSAGESDTFHSGGVLLDTETERHPVVSALGPVPPSLGQIV